MNHARQIAAQIYSASSQNHGLNTVSFSKYIKVGKVALCI